MDIVISYGETLRSKCWPPVKASAYVTYSSLPMMEYAAVAWNRYQLNIHTFQKSNHRAARWVMNDYSRYSSVSNLKHDLNWQLLQIYCRISKLQVFYKAVHNLMALSLPQHIYISFQQVVKLKLSSEPLY